MPHIPAAAKDSDEAMPERDLAIFFARLTATAEDALGSEALAERLSQLRRLDRDEENNAHSDNPALTRALRRLGFASPLPSSAAFAIDLARRTGETVSRPAKNILFLLELLALGDEQAGMAPVCTRPRTVRPAAWLPNATISTVPANPKFPAGRQPTGCWTDRPLPSPTPNFWPYFSTARRRPARRRRFWPCLIGMADWAPYSVPIRASTRFSGMSKRGKPSAWPPPPPCTAGFWPNFGMRRL